MFLRKIQFKKNWRCFKEGNIIKLLNPITLLVGDQGTGKSSLFFLLHKYKDHKDVVSIDCDKIEFVSFDTEKDNPRAKSYIETIFDVSCRYLSHGETLFPVLEHCKTYKDKLILIDEPESGLSLDSQYKLAKIFREILNNGCQIVIATHSIIFMEEFGEIYDIKKRKYRDSKNYLAEKKKLYCVK